MTWPWVVLVLGVLLLFWLSMLAREWVLLRRLETKQQEATESLTARMSALEQKQVALSNRIPLR